MATTRTMPATLRKYQALRRKKKAFCAGRTTKAEVTKAAKAYVTAAVAKGQPKTEAQRKADKVIKAGCSISGTVRKRKAATTTRKRAAATPKAKKTSTARRKRRA